MSHTRTATKTPRPHLSVGQVGFLGLSVFCLLLILFHSDTAILYMSQGLSLCAKTVIPSLFPFMVLSELLVASGGGELLGRVCQRPLRMLFGISGAGGCALMMGLVCGFPVGTKTAVSLCRRGDITPTELSRLICFCNIPSSAFLINALGNSLFGSHRFGLLSYLICLASALLCAALMHRLAPLDKQEPHQGCERAPALGVTTFTGAVTSAATAMLYVCAYVVFFSALVGTLGHLLAKTGLGQTALSLIFGLFELSGGVLQASAISKPAIGRVVAIFLCGWSGLSVHLQILSLCDSLPRGSVAVRPYLLAKLAQAVIGTLLFLIVSTFLPNDFFDTSQSVLTFAFSKEIPEQIPLIYNASFGFLLLLCPLCHCFDRMHDIS